MNNVVITGDEDDSTPVGCKNATYNNIKFEQYDKKSKVLRHKYDCTQVKMWQTFNLLSQNKCIK